MKRTYSLIKERKLKKKEFCFFEQYSHSTLDTLSELKIPVPINILDLQINKIIDSLRDQDCFKSEVLKLCIPSITNNARNIVDPSQKLHSKGKNIPLKYRKKAALSRIQFLAAVDYIIDGISSQHPQALGSNSNVSNFKSNIHNVLSFTKNQHIKASLLTRNIKLSSTHWMEVSTASALTPIPQHKLFAQFCLQLFHIIRLVLLRYFYVGITGFSQPVVYLKRSWHGLVHLHENRLRDRLTLAESRDVKAKKIRWVPKTETTSLRPIFLHRKDHKDRDNLEAVNFILKTVLLCTDVGKTRTTTKPSAHLLRKWKTFVHTWSERGRPKLYVVKTDIEDAYGNVDQGRLLETVRKWLVEAFSQHPSLSLCRSYNRRLHSRLYWFRELPSTHPKLCAHHGAPKLVRLFQGDLVCFVERYLRELSKVQVRIGRQCYRYSSGLLQGHPLSGYLCEIYYGDIYLRHHIGDAEPTLLLTAIDDMLYITADEALAESYLAFILDENCPVKINMSKLESNLRTGTRNSPCKKLFTFCGVNIDTGTLNVTGSYYNYHGRNTFHSFTFKNPNEAYVAVLRGKLSFFLSLKAHRIFFDTRFNSALTIARNVFELGVQLACRFNSLTIHLCIENSSHGVVQGTLADLSAHIARKLHWKSYRVRVKLVRLFLTEALVFITHKYDTLYEINRIELKTYLNSLLGKTRECLSYEELSRCESWLSKFKTKSLVPKMLMGGTK